jgi:ubiquinone/menaquinone biosynthesis C-methylase UbiE
MTQMIKAPDSHKTNKFYNDLTSGHVKRGMWGKGSRFDAVKIAAKPSVQKFLVEVVTSYLGKEQEMLDIGCGPGGFLKAIASHCGRITGIDITTSFVAECRAMIEGEGIRNATVMQGSATALPYINNSFDCVMMVDTIHHLDDVTTGLKEVFRVLKPGGTLIVFEPNKGNPLLALMCLFDRNEWGLLPLGSKRAYRRLFAKGYEELACEYNGLLIGPDSRFALSLAEFMTRPGWRSFLGWMSPKIFMAFRKEDCGA